MKDFKIYIIGLIRNDIKCGVGIYIWIVIYILHTKGDYQLRAT